MKKETLFEAIGRVDDALIEGAAEKKRTVHWKRWAVMAACLMLVVAGIATFPRMGANMSPGNTGSAADSGPDPFEFYSGPILPLTAAEGGEALSVKREVTLDFADGISRVGVSDRYTLHNETTEDVTATLLYPFVGSLRELEELEPELFVDGQTADTVLYAGGYTGDFQGAGDETTDLNLKQLKSWEEYRELLSGEDYLDRALGEHADLSGIPVTVYQFTGAWGPEESKEIPNPTIRAHFSLDYDKTVVLSYGFHGGMYNQDAGEMGRSFSIRKPTEYGYGEPCFLIVLGDDIENLTTQGYVTGGWDTKETIEYGVDIIRYETDLDTILNEVFDLMYRDQMESGDWYDRDMWYQLYCDYLAAYGLLSSDVVGRYFEGMLEGLDFDVVDRVFYLQTELTIPAGGRTTLLFNMTKEGSHHVPGKHSGQENGVYGYDMATALGSVLKFESQTAELINTEEIKIVKQNFGFDLESGITAVELDPAVEHYYLTVMKMEQE